eukprot:TRINITY_DN3716_c1_g1_i1.p1 TRINITY_DN3716_c1_g1~~TRINITY_DN3716_c1_g1_i1.p1  ORF type:complete len:831 (+),score=190.05 TRINITY_DN3716_c1_g1_i1:258-2495(+)
MTLAGPNRDQFVVWSDADGSALTVYRAPVSGGAAEVVCSQPSATGKAGAAGLAADDGFDASGAPVEANVYFTTLGERRGIPSWTVYKCGIDTLGGSPAEFQGVVTQLDWSGQLTYSAKYRTLYLQTTASRSSDILLYGWDIDNPGSPGTASPIAEKYYAGANGLGALSVCEPDGTLYLQVSSCSSGCLSDIVKLSADPAATGTPVTISAVVPSWMNIVDRPRATLGGVSNFPQPPNFAAVGDAPGWLLWSDWQTGELKLADVSAWGAGSTATVLATSASGPPKAGEMGLGPVAWYPVKYEPSTSPTTSPGMPSAQPSAPPSAAAAPPSTAPSAPPQVGSVATPTVAPSAPPVNGSAPATSPPSAPPNAAGTPPSASPAAAPPAASAAPVAAATPPPAATPGPASAAASEGDGGDSGPGFMAGLFAGLAIGLLCSVGLAVWYVMKLKRKRAELKSRVPQQPAPADESAALIDTAEREVPEPAPPPRKLPDFTPGTYRMLETVKASPALISTGEWSGESAAGSEVVIYEVLTSNGELRGRTADGYITLANDCRDFVVPVDPRAPASDLPAGHGRRSSTPRMAPRQASGAPQRQASGAPQRQASGAAALPAAAGEESSGALCGLVEMESCADGDGSEPASRRHSAHGAGVENASRRFSGQGFASGRSFASPGGSPLQAPAWSQSQQVVSPRVASVGSRMSPKAVWEAQRGLRPMGSAGSFRQSPLANTSISAPHRSPRATTVKGSGHM